MTTAKSAHPPAERDDGLRRAQGGAITSHVPMGSSTDITWQNRCGQPPRRGRFGSSPGISADDIAAFAAGG